MGAAASRDCRGGVRVRRSTRPAPAGGPRRRTEERARGARRARERRGGSTARCGCGRDHRCARRAAVGGRRGERPRRGARDDGGGGPHAAARGLALRAALGASRWRLVRAQLTECVVLALAAGMAGLAIGWLTLSLLVRLQPQSLPALDDVRLDPAVLTFTFGVSVVTALLFGAAPAFQAASAKLADALRHGASGVVRSGAGAGFRKVLVAAQMAISVVLLVSAGLLVRSVINLQHVDVGFDTRNLFTAQLSLPRSRYATPASRDELAQQLLERVRTLPGVVAATQAYIAPPNYVITGGLLEIRGAVLSDTDARGGYPFNFVRPNYFEMLGIRLLEGRTFTADEVR